MAECIIVIQWRFPVYGIYTHSPSGLVRVYSIHRKSPLYNYYLCALYANVYYVYYMTQRTKLAMHLAQEKGTSSWISALPIEDYGFYLLKGAFRDAVALRYGWPLPNLPKSCVCGRELSVEHAFTCNRGGFPSLRHNDVRDLTADLMAEVCHCVSTEPDLQPLSGEVLQGRSANCQDGARVDIKAQGFWEHSQDAFFDIS